MSLTRVDERERQAALEEEQARLKALKVRPPPPLLTQLPNTRFLRLLLSGVGVGNAALVYQCGPRGQH